MCACPHRGVCSKIISIHCNASVCNLNWMYMNLHSPSKGQDAASGKKCLWTLRGLVCCHHLYYLPDENEFMPKQPYLFKIHKHPQQRNNLHLNWMYMTQHSPSQGQAANSKKLFRWKLRGLVYCQHLYYLSAVYNCLLDLIWVIYCLSYRHMLFTYIYISIYIYTYNGIVYIYIYM